MPAEFTYPPELPVSGRRDEILAELARSPVVIVCGDTGSGKTTQLPKMLLEHLSRTRPNAAGAAPARRVACTQPRRLAAVTVAERVAHELNTPAGGLVGWRHRFAEKISPDTRLTFMTDGILLAETRHDRLLKAYDAIIVDEAHERSLNVDFLLGILKRILRRRHDLKVIVSSATLDVARFAAFFDGAPIVEVPGRLFPIEVVYRPPPADDERDLPRDVAAAVRTLPPHDDILVFLPGERDIRETADRLARTQAQDDIIPLLASLPASEQQRAFRLSSRRRIVLATNVAETSVTIPGIRCVIDSGLARLSRYVHRTHVQRLQIEPISQASARQRAGRCGRLGPGTCVRLYAEEDFAAREPFTPPEVLRASLAGVILTMLDLQLGAIDDFPFLEAPRPAMIREGYRELLELGALARDAHGDVCLSPIGRRLARLAIEPRLGRMLLAAADFGILPSALPVIAAMACDDPRRRPAEEREKAAQAHAPFRVAGSDFLGTRALWNWWTRETQTLSQSRARALAKKTYLSYPKMREWRDLVQQLLRHCNRLGLDTQNDTDDPATLHRALLTGLLARLGHLDPETHTYRGAHGLRFALHPGSVLAKPPKRAASAPSPGASRPASSTRHAPEWIVAGELVDTARLFARSAAEIDPAWIEPAAGALCRRHCHSPEYDPATGFVRAIEQVTLYGLVIVPARRCDFSRYDPALARTIFIRRALVDGDFPRPPPPVRANNAFLDALRRYAEKTRHPEYFDADALAAYFARLLPSDICSADALRKWLRASPPAAFTLRKADWWPHADAPSRDFPETLQLGEARAKLTYRHTPDDPETDGITCTISRAHAAALKLWPADYLVPGALPEKITWLLTMLPSAQRRVLAPLADTVAGILPHLKPGAEPLTAAVRRIVYEQWGFRIAPDAWDAARLPPHLQVRFAIRDDRTGRILVCSRNLDEALARIGAAAGDAAAARTPAPSATTWVFGTLPEKIASGQAGWTLEHFPALRDDTTGVTRQLYADAATAARVHAAGVTRLYLFALGPAARLPVRRRDLPARVADYLKAMDYTPEAIADDILAGAVRDTLVRDLPPVRDAATFHARLDERRAALVETQFNRHRFFIELMDAAADVRARLADVRVPEATASAVSTQLTWLICRGFPRYVPGARLAHFARYLRGMCVRLERARNAPASDAAKDARLMPYWTRYVDAVTGANKGPFDPVALQRYRWLVEEYRISLFAQELKTSEPVSPPRLDAAWHACTSA